MLEVRIVTDQDTLRVIMMGTLEHADYAQLVKDTSSEQPRRRQVRFILSKLWRSELETLSKMVDCADRLALEGTGCVWVDPLPQVTSQLVLLGQHEHIAPSDAEDILATQGWEISPHVS